MKQNMNRAMVVELAPTVVHPAVDPMEPIAYIVILNPGETPTDYNMSGGIPGDYDLEWFDTRNFPIKEGCSVEDIIKAVEYEYSYEKPSSGSNPYKNVRQVSEDGKGLKEGIGHFVKCLEDEDYRKSSYEKHDRKMKAKDEWDKENVQNDHVVECWHRRDRLWVIFYNHRRYVDPEAKWEDYFAPHEKGGCNWPEEDCDSCLMAGILSHTGLDHGIRDMESALEKIKSFADYWIWEDGQLRGGE